MKFRHHRRFEEISVWLPKRQSIRTLLHRPGILWQPAHQPLKKTSRSVSVVVRPPISPSTLRTNTFLPGATVSLTASTWPADGWNKLDTSIPLSIAWNDPVRMFVA